MHWVLKAKKPGATAGSSSGPTYTKVRTQENQMADLGEEPASDWEDFDDNWDQNPISVVVDKPSGESTKKSDRKAGGKGTTKSKPVSSTSLSPIRESQTPTSPSSPHQQNTSTSFSPVAISLPPSPDVREQTSISSSSLPPASSLLSLAVSGIPTQTSNTTVSSAPSPKKPLPAASFGSNSPATGKSKLQSDQPVEIQEKEEDFFSDLGLVPEYKEQQKIKAPVASVSQKKPAPAPPKPTASQVAAAASRYSVDSLMESNEVVGEAWGGGDDLMADLPDSEGSDGPSDGRKKKKPKPTGSKGKKKKGLLASPDSGSDGKKKNKLVASVDDDIAIPDDIDNI
jgi:hypothetical protein